ncbi:unnamed protein product, partial [Hapterophycus canaliculatus]
GSSPRPPTPGTPGTHGTNSGAAGGAGAGAGARMAPSPNGRRRGEDAFPPEHFALPSPNDPLGANGLLGGPSPKSRRVGVRNNVPLRFPGSPQAGLSPRVGFPPQSPLSGGGPGSGFGVTCSPLGGSDRTYFPAPAAAALADASSRGHRRSNSSGLNGSWGSAPRHGGGGEGGLDAGSNVNTLGGGAAAAAGANASAGSGATSAGFQGSTTTGTASAQNWSVRLGEKAKQTKQSSVLGGSMSASRQHGWGLSSGEMQQTSRLQGASPSNAQQQQQQQQQQQKPTTSRARNHGVVRRRHSAPIPPLQTFPAVPGAGSEWAGEAIMGMGIARSSSTVKVESQAKNRQPLEGCGTGGGGGGGNALESFSVNFYGAATGGAATWGSASTAPAAAMKVEATEGQWQQQQQAGGGVGAGSTKVEMSAAAAETATEVPTGSFDASFDGSFGAGSLMDSHDMTTAMSVDL